MACVEREKEYLVTIGFHGRHQIVGDTDQVGARSMISTDLNKNKNIRISVIIQHFSSEFPSQESVSNKH